MTTALTGEVIPQTAPERNRQTSVTTGIRIIQRSPEAQNGDLTRAGWANDSTRKRYSRMARSMELAAVILAAGGTHRQAAKAAGVVRRQITKYMTDPVFRIRLNELHEIVKTEIQGRVLTEFGRRTDPKRIKNLEVMELARIYDRVAQAPGTRSSGAQDPNDAGAGKYDLLLEQIISTDAGSEGADFPDYRPTNLQLPEGSSPLD